MPNEPKPAAEKRPHTKRRENDQGDHEGSAHSPKEFDVMNPQKQINDANKEPPKPKKSENRH
ncbi:MAG: hypothetical protein IKD58_04180 [Loktanella sp.]|nr:hypothetical protein [Loktanella sp.]